MSLPKADEWNDPGSMDPIPGRRRHPLFRVSLFFLIGLAIVFAWTRVSLVRLPDIGTPFDLAKKGKVELPFEENAYTYYRAAISKLVANRPGSSIGKAYSWNSVNQNDRDWFFANLDALKVWYTGTTMERALFVEPNEQTWDASSLAQVQRMRAFPTLARIAAMRMESQGDFGEAWAFYRAVLRSSRHVAMYGSFIERLIAVSMYQSITNNIYAWSDHPNLNIDQLKKSLDDIYLIDAMGPSLRENLEAEYFGLSKLLDTPNLTTWKIDEVIKGVARQSPPSFLERADEVSWKYLLREPERSKRVLSLCWANWLSVADLSLSDRAKLGHKFFVGTFYDPPADAPESAKKLSPEQLKGWVESTRYCELMLAGRQSLEQALVQEQKTRASLLIHIAERLYAREHGSLPEKTEQLIGPYLKAMPDGYVPVASQP
jgi:hypothetical protein